MPKRLQPIGAHKTNTAPPESPLVKDSEKDVVRSFMSVHPKGSLPDEPEEVRGADGEVVPDTFDSKTPEQPELALETETPQGATPEDGAVAPAVSEAPSAESQGKAEATAPSEPTQPTQAQPQAEAAKPVAERSYDPTEKIALVPGSEDWTREQVVLGLQERANLIPRAEEAEKFRATFGGNYEETEARWKPFLERVAAAPPAQREFAEHVLAQTDPALLDYLQRSEQYFYSPEGGGFQRPTELAKPAQSPELAEMRSVAQAMQKQLINSRVQNEWQTIDREYPFVARNPKVKQALIAVASRIFAEDEKSGKSPLECRGLLDAMNEQRVFLDTMKIAADNAHHVSAQTPSAPPASGPQALLTSNGPGASGAARRSAPEREEYHGNPKDPYGGDPVKAFLSKHPGS